MSLEPLAQCGWIAAGASGLMLVCWLIQQRTRDAGIVDAAWAAGLGSSAIFAAITGDGEAMRRLAVGVMGGIWGFRLAMHILMDRVLKGPEDGRYQMMREKLGGTGPRVSLVFFLFFQAQALLIAALCWPFLLAATANEKGLGFPIFLDYLAAALWLIGIIGEWQADKQLKDWKAAQPAGSRGVCDVGLWRYSRHPNYFFEWLMWCSFALLAWAYDPPRGFWALLAPAFMLFLVLKVTGIPPTEARSLKSRGDAYRDYQRRTSAFFPWFTAPSQREGVGGGQRPTSNLGTETRP